MGTKKGWTAMVAVVIALGVLLVGPGCGNALNPLSPSASFPLSQTSIETATLNFVRGISGAASSASSIAPFTQPVASQFDVGGRLAIIPRGPFETYQVYWPLNYKTTCAAGGYHEVVGHISGTVNPTGISYLIMNSTQNIRDYRCMATGWSLNGDPFISISGSFSLNSSRQAIDFDLSRGWVAVKDAGGTRVGCQHSMSMDWDNLTGGRIQGTMTCTPPTTSFTFNQAF